MMLPIKAYNGEIPVQDRNEFMRKGMNSFANVCEKFINFRESNIEPQNLTEAKQIINNLKEKYCDAKIEAEYAKMISASYGIQTRVEYRPADNTMPSRYHSLNFVPNYIDSAAQACDNLVAAAQMLQFKYK